MKKGEIWFVRIPSSDGREQSGIRPVLVVSEPVASVCMVIPFTSNVQALRLPFTLEVRPSPENGLDAASVSLVFQLRAIDRERFGRKIGQLEASYLRKIDDQIRRLLQL